MFIIVKNDILFPEYIHDTVSSSAENSYYYLTGEVLPQGSDVTAMLKEKFGTVNQDNQTYDIYSLVEITPVKYVCPKCGGVIQQTDTLDCFTINNRKGRYVGMISRQGLESAFSAAKLIEQCHCPICEHWDDGFGTFCDCHGFNSTEGLFDDNMEYYQDCDIPNFNLRSIE